VVSVTGPSSSSSARPPAPLTPARPARVSVPSMVTTGSLGARTRCGRLSPETRARTLNGVTDAPSASAPGSTETSGPVVFLGDSLTESGRWDELFPQLTTVNAGRAGDTTADVQDRLGEVIALAPSVVVVMVGTNDFGLRATVEQVVRGTENILWTLHHELPGTRIVVVSVLPRERERAEWIRQVNIHVRQFAPSVKAEFVDLWPAFAEEDGELSPRFTTDRVHLNDDGYAAWADALRPHLPG
jgi:lysophospholipase L1-like esterase